MARVQFGWILPAGPRGRTSPAGYLPALQRGFDLIRGAFDSFWMIDHLQEGTADMLEGWTTIAYLAAMQPAFRCGHTVLCQSLRNPALLAKMVATLQFLTGGRYICGLGAGWNEDEYRAYGYPFPPASTRVAELDETLQIVKALWQGGAATVEGVHYRVRAAYCEPRPDPRPPILVGARGPRMLRLAARHADWWDVSSTGIAEYQRLAAECDRACAEVGRDPATLRRTWSGGCVCAPSEAEVRALTAPNYEPGVDFVGTPAQLIEQMQPFVALGVDYFMLDCGGFPDLTTLEMLKTEVLPALNGGVSLTVPR